MSRATFPWTPELERLAKDLRGDGMPWCKVAARIGCSDDTVRGRLDAEWKARRRAGVNAARRRNGLSRSATGHTHRASGESSERRDPIFDPKRDGCFEHESLTAALMGDPFPGRSEIMRRAT